MVDSNYECTFASHLLFLVVAILLHLCNTHSLCRPLCDSVCLLLFAGEGQVLSGLQRGGSGEACAVTDRRECDGSHGCLCGAHAQVGAVLEEVAKQLTLCVCVCYMSCVWQFSECHTAYIIPAVLWCHAKQLLSAYAYKSCFLVVIILYKVAKKVRTYIYMNT